MYISKLFIRVAVHIYATNAEVPLLSSSNVENSKCNCRQIPHKVTNTERFKMTSIPIMTLCRLLNTYSYTHISGTSEPASNHYGLLFSFLLHLHTMSFNRVVFFIIRKENLLRTKIFCKRWCNTLLFATWNVYIPTHNEHFRLRCGEIDFYTWNDNVDGNKIKIGRTRQRLH